MLLSYGNYHILAVEALHPLDHLVYYFLIYV